MPNHFRLGLLVCAPLLVAGCGDINDPVISAPVITITAMTQSSASISWGKATDGTSKESALVYKVYLSGANPAYQSFNTVGAVEAGTLTHTLTDASSATISSGIVPGNAYYINVVVEDEEGNKALYEPLGEFFHAGQISYYPFSGNTNDVESTTPNTLIVATGLALPTITSDRFSHAGSAYNFAPATPQCLQSTSSVGITGNASRSVSFWVQSSNPAAGATRAVFAWGNDGGNGTSFGFIESGLNSFWAAWLGTTNAPISSAVTSNWEHWVIVSTGGTVSAYKNDSAVTVTMGGAAVSTLDSLLYVGCGMVGAALGYPYQGKIDDVRIFNLALAPADVTKLYAVTRP